MSSQILPWLVFLVGFPAFWIFVGHNMAKLGWSRLTAQYRAPREPDGKKLGGASGLIGTASYAGVINLWLAREGLYLRPMALFRWYHPALLIPWSQVGEVLERDKGTYLKFTLDQTPIELVLAGPHRADFLPYLPR